MEPEGCRRGGSEEGRVEELTRITKTPKWQRAPGERVTARSAARSARHEGGEKVYLLTTSPRERVCGFLRSRGKAGRASQITEDSQKNGKAHPAPRANVKMSKRRSAFSVAARQSFTMSDRVISRSL